MKKGGPSLNPLGRPKGAAGLAQYVSEQTNGGTELVDRLLKLSRNDTNMPRAAFDATLALLDRLAGRPVQATQTHLLIEGGNQPPANWDQLSAVERRQIIAQRRAALGATPLVLASSSENDE